MHHWVADHTSIVASSEFKLIHMIYMRLQALYQNFINPHPNFYRLFVVQSSCNLTTQNLWRWVTIRPQRNKNGYKHRKWEGSRMSYRVNFLSIYILQSLMNSQVYWGSMMDTNKPLSINLFKHIRYKLTSPSAPFRLYKFHASDIPHIPSSMNLNVL